MPRPLARLAPTLFALLLGLLLASPAAGQEGSSGITEIKFVTIEGSPGPAFYSPDPVTLRVAGEVCLTHEFTDDDPSVVRLGGPDQPAVCSAEGEYIRFYDAEDQLLLTRLRVSPGERLEFINWFPWSGVLHSGAGLELDRPIADALLVLADGTPCAVARFGPDDPDAVRIGPSGPDFDPACARRRTAIHHRRRRVSHYD